MSSEDFSDAALVLVGHGTELNAGSSAPVFQHADELRRRKCFGAVREAFWKQEPRVVEIASNLPFRRIIFVPLFVSEGYFSGQVIPQALGFPEPGEAEARVQQRGDQTLIYCRPVGTHRSMPKVLLARARDVVQQFPLPRAPKSKDITLFIAGHGTELHENSSRAVEQQADVIRSLDAYAAVHTIFLDQEPRIPACYGLAQTKNIVVVPFFISDGLHVTEDIPVLLGEPERLVQQRLRAAQPTWRNPTEKQGKLVWYTASVGTEPLLADVILERAREGAGLLFH